MDNEIACIDCSPLQDNEMAPFCAVGLWNDISVSLLSLPDLKTLDKSQVCASFLYVLRRLFELESFGSVFFSKKQIRTIILELNFLGIHT